MKKLSVYLYPFLFALYPILALRNFNITYVSLSSIVRPILLSLLATGVLWGTLRLAVKKPHKAGIITTLIIISFFSYGHLHINSEKIFGTLIRHRYLSLLFIILVLALSSLIIWKLKETKGIVNFLATTGGILILITLFQYAQHDLSAYLAGRQIEEEQASIEPSPASTDIQKKPDIYLLLLDGHTSSDILSDHYGLDNTEFIQQLEDIGFYVADCSQSNYPATKFSVTSTFYANYQDGITLYPLSSSFVIQTVRSLGYKVITFENRSNGHFDINEDERLSRNTMFGRVSLTGGLSEFEMMLMTTSATKIIYDMPQLVPGLNPLIITETEFYEHYQQTFYILDELQNIPDREEPTFVFAHLLVPHPPYVFTPTGEFLWLGHEKRGYQANVEFIDSHIVPVVENIIKKSDIPPIIIIMGDHGPSGDMVSPAMRMAILNAYYVNEAAKEDLYESITPVNSFRVIFNNYFNRELPLLEDISYHAYTMKKMTPENIIENTCKK